MISTDDKIQLGKLLDKHRIILIYYFSKNDVYLIRYLNRQDREVSEEIKGDILD